MAARATTFCMRAEELLVLITCSATSGPIRSISLGSMARRAADHRPRPITSGTSRMHRATRLILLSHGTPAGGQCDIRRFRRHSGNIGQDAITFATSHNLFGAGPAGNVVFVAGATDGYLLVDQNNSGAFRYTWGLCCRSGRPQQYNSLRTTGRRRHHITAVTRHSREGRPEMGRPFLCSHPLPAEIHRADLSSNSVRGTARLTPPEPKRRGHIDPTIPPSQAGRARSVSLCSAVDYATTDRPSTDGRRRRRRVPNRRPPGRHSNRRLRTAIVRNGWSRSIGTRGYDVGMRTRLAKKQMPINLNQIRAHA